MTLPLVAAGLNVTFLHTGLLDDRARSPLFWPKWMRFQSKRLLRVQKGQEEVLPNFAIGIPLPFDLAYEDTYPRFAYAPLALSSTVSPSKVGLNERKR
eukprot:7388697-Prymnesium_polylepis.2